MKVLIAGGASCGKSQVAEDLCQSLGGNLVYLAAMQPFGEEGLARIRKHRAQRAGKGFLTIECFKGLHVALADNRVEGATVLLEDLGNVVANCLFGGGAHEGKPLDIDILAKEIVSDLEALARRCAHIVVVGNEVGCDGICHNADTTRYQLLLGRVEQAWGAYCDLVSEVQDGIPQPLKTIDFNKVSWFYPFNSVNTDITIPLDYVNIADRTIDAHKDRLG